MKSKFDYKKIPFIKSVISAKEEAQNLEPVSDDVKDLVAKTSGCGCKSKKSLEKLCKKYENIK